MYFLRMYLLCAVMKQNHYFSLTAGNSSKSCRDMMDDTKLIQSVD